ncbi:MAG: hypothetical protein ACLP2F_15760 [Steroidobacteraceae bacterium]
MNEKYSRAWRLDRIGIFRTAVNPSWGLREKLATRCNPASLQAGFRHPWRTRSAPAPSPVFHAPENTYPIQPSSSFSVIHE